ALGPPCPAYEAGDGYILFSITRNKGKGTGDGRRLFALPARRRHSDLLSSSLWTFCGVGATTNIGLAGSRFFATYCSTSTLALPARHHLLSVFVPRGGRMRSRPSECVK
ncbi:MAG: hypothetical protein JXB48_12460, partial [Candidatus Latescibacteria bacterium]|nr:hypothetical protein [Candidatus Latescibacterota bacterium]